MTARLTYTAEDAKAFTDIMFPKEIKSKMIYILCVLPLLCVVFRKLECMFIIPLIIIGWVLAAVIYIYFVLLNPKIFMNNLKKQGNIEFFYKFNENSADIQIISDKINQNVYLNYEEIEKIKETENNLFMYVSGNKIYVIKKDSFTDCSYQDFKNFISAKVKTEFL